MTIDQLAVKVLMKLGVYNPPTSPADLENVTDAYKSVYAVLADDGLVTWALNTGAELTDIPDRFVLSFTTLVAAEIADFYQVPPPPEGWLKTKQLVINQIRRQLATAQETETVTAEYF